MESIGLVTLLSSPHTPSGVETIFNLLPAPTNPIGGREMNGRDHYDMLYKKSIEYLKSVSALELMRDAEALRRDIRQDIRSHHLPCAVVIGVLMGEIQAAFDRSESLATEMAVTKMADGFKKYLDENFMKKEKNQENR